MVQLSSDRLHGFLLRLRPAARGSRLASPAASQRQCRWALCLACGAASCCSRSGSGLELVVGGFACRDAFGFVLVCLDTLAISLVDCVDRFYVAARRSTGYGYTNSRSCSAAAIPASLAALECRFRLSLPPGHPLLTAAHTLTPRLQCCEYLPQRCTTLLRSAANGLTYRELPSAHTLQRRR